MADSLKPYYTSTDLIEAIKRNISFPISQNTISETGILAMANEEMLIDQVPAVLSYHEEYYVFSQTIPLATNVSRYPIPSRAVGMRLRDLAYKDTNNNLFEMSRINSTDKSFFQRSNTSNAGINKFYLEGNDVVLTPTISSTPQGSLVFYYYIRPNQLVDNSRAAISSSITSLINPINKSCMVADINTATDTITITSHGFLTNQTVKVSSNDTIPGGLSTTINYYVQVLSANTFQLALAYSGAAVDITSTGVGIQTFTQVVTKTNIFDVTNIDLTNNLINIPNHSYVDGNKVMFSTNDTLLNELSSTRIYYIVSTTQSTFKVSLTLAGPVIDLQSVGTGTHTITSDLINIGCTTTIPSNITNSSVVDFLQTEGGHTILSIDQIIPDNAVSGSTITIRNSMLPQQFVIGDYICLAKEAIIPFLPSDLHFGLAERTCARILSSIGDKDGLALSNDKMSRIKQSESHLLNNRVEGSPEKILNRHSILRYSKSGRRRRF